ncbi:MAG: outer membrane beta-barrel protein [Bacteroidota bacterium]
MKKIILALLTTCSVAAVNAQTNSILLYGDLGVNRNSTDAGSNMGTTTRTTWDFMPGIGYQFTRHVTLGLQGGYGSMQNDFPNNGTVNRNSTFDSKWGMGMFLRYTENLGRTFAIYGQFNAGYIGTQHREDNTNTNGGSTTTTLNGFGASVYPAVRVNVYRNFALNFNFGGFDLAVLSGDNGVGGTRTADHFGFNFGRQMNVGVSKNFGCCVRPHHHDEEPAMENRRMRSSDDDDDIPMPKKVKKAPRKVEDNGNDL